MSENNWYDVKGWYEPAADNRNIPETAAVYAARPGKGWTRARVAGLIILALALIVGTSLAFAAPVEHNFSVIWGADDIPDVFEDELPEDWDEFFEDYYTEAETIINPSNIPTVKLETDFRLELENAGDEEISLQQLYADCAESIVAIYGYSADLDGYSWGTGIIMSGDGLILTNAHVVGDCDSAVVKLHDDSEYDAMLVGSDTISDIAVLKIEADGLKPARFGRSDQLSVGQAVAAIGNPLGEEFRSTLTHGIVSAIERGVNIDGHSMALLQTNAAINEGNSGGALFNMYGQVVGITNLKMRSVFSNIEGIGFAIPSSTVRSVVNSLVRYGQVVGRPALGLVIGSVPSYVAEHYQLPEGLYVSQVMENSDAARQGMQAGDIITHVNFQPAESADQINAIKNTLEVGDIMMFTVWRDGEKLEFEVALVDTNSVYK